MSRRYEQRGGDYVDKGDNKNKAQKGAPEKKAEDEYKPDNEQ